MSKNIWLPAYDKTDVENVNSQPIFQGKYIQFLKLKLRFRTFAGEWSSDVDRFILNKLHAAAILLFNPHEEYVVLLEQFRIGAMYAGKSPWILEPVAGLIENSDTPQNTAIREAKEESGCDVVDLIPITSYLASPGTTNEETFLYCGKIDNCELGVYGLEHESEDIKVHKFKVKDAFELVKSKTIFCAQAIIALQWLELNYDNVLSKWK